MTTLLLESFLCPLPIMILEADDADDVDYANEHWDYYSDYSSSSSSNPACPPASSTCEPVQSSSPPPSPALLHHSSISDNHDSCTTTASRTSSTSTHGPVVESKVTSSTGLLGPRLCYVRMAEGLDFVHQEPLTVMEACQLTFASVVLGLNLDSQHLDDETVTLASIDNIEASKAWKDLLKDYSAAWTKKGGYSNVYRHLVRLINWLVNEMHDRHGKDSSCFPGIQSPEANDTQAGTIQGSPAPTRSPKPDVVFVHVTAHPTEADSREANLKKPSKIYHARNSELDKGDAPTDTMATSYASLFDASSAGRKRRRDLEEGVFETARKKMRVPVSEAYDDSFPTTSSVDGRLSVSLQRESKDNNCAGATIEDDIFSDYGEPHGHEFDKAVQAKRRKSDAQVFGYAFELFQNHNLLRNHVITLAVTKQGFQFVYCDRSVTIRVDLFEDWTFFIIFIYGLLRLDMRGWGIMTSQTHNTINLAELGKVINKQSVDCVFSHLETGQPLFHMDGIIFASESIVGRGTRVFTGVPCEAVPSDIRHRTAGWQREQLALEKVWKERVDNAEKTRQARLVEPELLEEAKRKQVEIERQKYLLLTLKEQLCHHLHPPEPLPPLTAQEEANVIKRIKESPLMDFTATRRVGKVIAKISSPSRTQEKEYKIVQRLTTAEAERSYKDHLPDFYAHYNFKFAKDTAQARFLCWKGIDYEMRHLEVIIQDLRYPITQIYDLKDMAAAYADISKVLVWLDYQGVHHHDVSLSNCQFRLVNPKKHNGRLTLGVLSDFDLSTYNNSDSPSTNLRTGTVPFISTRVLYVFDKPGRHLLRDDIESLFWVIAIHIATYYLDGGVYNGPHRYREWFTTNCAVMVAHMKSSVLLGRPVQCLPGYNVLVPSLIKMQEKLREITLHTLRAPPTEEALENADGRFIVKEFQEFFEEFAAAADK